MGHDWKTIQTPKPLNKSLEFVILSEVKNLTVRRSII